MAMPKEIYYALNQAFDAVRTAEKKATELESEAQEIRDRAREDVRGLYELINRASITLATSDDKAAGA